MSKTKWKSRAYILKGKYSEMKEVMVQKRNGLTEG